MDLQHGLRSAALERLAVRVFDAVRRDPGPVFATVQANPVGGPLRELRGWHGCTRRGDQRLLEPLDELAPVVVPKTGYGAAGVLPVSELRGHQAVYVVGADTDACVLATALGLFDEGCSVVVPAHLTHSSGGGEAQRAGLAVLSRQLGRSRVIDAVGWKDADG